MSKKNPNFTFKGRKHTEETKERMNEAKLDVELSEDHKKHISEAREGMKLSEEHKRHIGDAQVGMKRSDESKKNMSEAQVGHSVSVETCKKISKSMKGRKRSKEAIEKTIIACTGRKNSEESKRNMREAANLRKKEISENNKRLIKNGDHNWPGERPCNNPTERVLDFALIPIFLADTHHNFKSLNESIACREFQLDFVSWLLRFGVEADEPDHKRPEKKAWDNGRDKFIEDSKVLDFTLRYSTEYLVEHLVDAVKEIARRCNEQREKYKLCDLSEIVYDERWTPYYQQEQELLKEWYSKKESKRFKIFRDKKRELDKQWLWLLEEEDKKYGSNFATVYIEILEKDLKLTFKNIVSPWRKSLGELL